MAVSDLHPIVVEEMTETTRTADFTRRTYRAGGFLMMLAGVIGAIVGLGLLIASATTPPLGLTPILSAILGGVTLVFSVIEFAGGVRAYQGKNWYGSMTAAMLGLVTFFTLPLDLMGAVLIALGEGNFER